MAVKVVSDVAADNGTSAGCRRRSADTIKAEAMATLRGLIDKVVLTPDAAAPNGFKADLYGDLAPILAACDAAEPNGRQPRAGARGCQLRAVAGPGIDNSYCSWSDRFRD